MIRTIFRLTLTAVIASLPMIQSSSFAVTSTIPAIQNKSPNLCVCFYEDQDHSSHKSGCRDWIRKNADKCTSSLMIPNNTVKEDIQAALTEKNLDKPNYLNVYVFGSHHGTMDENWRPYFRAETLATLLVFDHLFYDSFACYVFHELAFPELETRLLKVKFPERSFTISGNQNVGVAGFGAGVPITRFLENMMASSKVTFEITPNSKDVSMRFAACSPPHAACGIYVKSKYLDPSEGPKNMNIKSCTLPSGEIVTQECRPFIGDDIGYWAAPKKIKK